MDLRLNTAVKSVHADGVVVEKEHTFRPAGLVVRASGVILHDTVADWGVPQGCGGRIMVGDHLRVRGLDSVLAVRDIGARHFLCLRLPDQFGEYAVSAFASLAQHEHAKAVPLAELGRVIGKARAEHAVGAGSDPIATVAASAPDLEDLLMCARDHDDLHAALLTL